MATLCKETMIRSYNWTSFSPERRGAADFSYYTDLLASDLETLGESTGNYERKFCERVMLIFHRQSRCASPMIAGPANFNNRRNAKRWDSRDRAASDFEHWRKKYIKAVTRERTLSPEAEIDKTLEELERLEDRQTAYKAANRLKTREAREAYLKEHYEFGERERQLFDFLNHDKIPSFAITSMATKIRERKKKLEVMKSRIENKSNFMVMEFPGGRVSIENDRVVISHAEKPRKEVIEAIRSNGFRYSPKTTSWVRKHTANAVYAAKQLLPILGGAQ